MPQRNIPYRYIDTLLLCVQLKRKKKRFPGQMASERQHSIASQYDASCVV